MTRYKMRGFGRETNRKRIRIYEAADKEAAFDLAFEDGLIVDVEAIEVLPDLPPTEKQLRLVKELRLYPPENLTKKGISEFIDTALENNNIKKRYVSLLPTQEQLEFAKELNVNIPPDVTRQKLSVLIDKAIEEKEG